MLCACKIHISISVSILRNKNDHCFLKLNWQISYFQDYISSSSIYYKQNGVAVFIQL